MRGNILDPGRVAQLQPGQQNRDAVRDLLGPPTTYGPFSDKTWFYISQRDSSVAFSRPEVLDRQIVAITFDDNGRIAEVRQLDESDSREVAPVARVTPTPGREFTLLQQLLGNLGRFEGQEGSGPSEP